MLKTLNLDEPNDPPNIVAACREVKMTLYELADEVGIHVTDLLLHSAGLLALDAHDRLAIISTLILHSEAPQCEALSFDEVLRRAEYGVVLKRLLRECDEESAAQRIKIGE